MSSPWSFIILPKYFTVKDPLNDTSLCVFMTVPHCSCRPAGAPPTPSSSCADLSSLCLYKASSLTFCYSFFKLFSFFWLLLKDSPNSLHMLNSENNSTVHSSALWRIPYWWFFGLFALAPFDLWPHFLSPCCSSDQIRSYLQTFLLWHPLPGQFSQMSGWVTPHRLPPGSEVRNPGLVHLRIAGVQNSTWHIVDPQ